MTPPAPLEVVRIPALPYAQGLALQGSWVQARRRGEIPDRLLLVEHPHVVTLGRGTRSEHLLLSPRQLSEQGYEVHEAGRGGDVTYHGPGQLVGYPILDLKPGGPGEQRPDRRDLHRYLRDLEEVLIRVLDAFGLEGTRVPGLTGVWTEGGKVAALGVRVSSGWITSHGFALNVAPDLSRFGAIVPCGIPDRPVTSLARLLPAPPDRATVESLVIRAFTEVFGSQVREGPQAGEIAELQGSSPGDGEADGRTSR